MLRSDVLICRFTTRETIYFGGSQGKVLALSPHKSNFILKLSGRIAIKGIYNSDFVWATTTNNLKGFLSNRFTLYVGTRSNVGARLIKEKITKAGGKARRGHTCLSVRSRVPIRGEGDRAFS